MADGTKGSTTVDGGKVSNFDAAMGVRLVRASSDEVVLEYDIAEQHLQPYGIVHGGVHCAMSETACSMAAAINAAPQGRSVVGLENHTSFVRAARSGRVTVTAKPITRGRRSQLWEATSRDEQDQILAIGRVRLLCLEPDAVVAGEAVHVKRS